MPFDVAKMCGKWKYGSYSDNFPQIMEKLDVSAEDFEKRKAAEFPYDITLSGNVLTSRLDFMGKVIENTYTLGQEGMEESPGGKKARVTWTMEGECLVSTYPDQEGKGFSVRTSRHFVDDNTMHVTIKAGDMEGWSTIKRC